MKNTEQKAQWVPMTSSVVLKCDNLIKINKWQSSECCVNNAHIYPLGPGRAEDINLQLGNITNLVNSDLCLGTKNLRAKEYSLRRNQNNKDTNKRQMNKGLPDIHLLNGSLTSNVTHKIAKQCMELYAGPGMTTVKYPYLINSYMPTHSSKNLSNLKRNTNGRYASIMIVPKLAYSKYIPRFYTSRDPFFEISSSIKQNEYNSSKSINATHLKNAVTRKEGLKNPQYLAADYHYDSSTRHELATKIRMGNIKSNISYIGRLKSCCAVQLQDDRDMQLQRQSSFKTLKVHIGPYAQQYIVYNVKKQANAQTKEQGTSQQFKQKSQGIGSASISGNDSSSGSAKRRQIKIESGCTFSVSFTDRGKSTDSGTSGPEPVTDTKSKKGKKDLHRCLCTTSFPTDDKKLKKKPCDSGACVPGKCSPSECFKRLQEKYGKKSASDVSSSQASQTSKKKGKTGKETVVKGKGSSSISKYKESVEAKPLPEKEKDKEKFDIVKAVTNCCKKMQFWKKDKAIELKPAVIGTDISLKDDKAKTFGSNAATQSGKKKGKKEVKKEKKDVKKEQKEDKKEKIGDTKDKKEKKDVKKEQKENKKEKIGDKNDKKEKKEDKKGKKEKKEDQKAKKDVKKEKKVSKKTKEEVTTVTKATGAKTKKGRTLQPYECEPGVCTPKVCIPQECYARKFPPPPKQVESKFLICLRKLCCRKTVVEEKPGGVSAATQARKPGAPEMPPGTTVYKDAGSKTKKGAQRQAIDTPAQLPEEGGDVLRSKKPTAYSGIQYFQSVDNDTMMQRQGVNIGSECGCSVEFYKTKY